MASAISLRPTDADCSRATVATKQKPRVCAGLFVMPEEGLEPPDTRIMMACLEAGLPVVTPG
jgi:hypothetical protein